MFGRATRRKLEELQRDLRHAKRDRDLYNSLYDEEAFRYGCYRLEVLMTRATLRDHNARLRRELDSARNHVPLLGTVFNGDVL